MPNHVKFLREEAKWAGEQTAKKLNAAADELERLKRASTKLVETITAVIDLLGATTPNQPLSLHAVAQTILVLREVLADPAKAAEEPNP